MYLHITQVHLDMATPSGFGKAHIEVGGGDSFRECTSTAAVGGRALDCEHTIIINVTGTCMCIIRHIHRMSQVKIFVYVYMYVINPVLVCVYMHR